MESPFLFWVLGHDRAHPDMDNDASEIYNEGIFDTLLPIYTGKRSKLSVLQVVLDGFKFKADHGTVDKLRALIYS
jgi:hypothetical protein